MYKNSKFFLKPTFGGLKGNVRTSSIAGGKARGRLPIRNNWIFRLIRYEQKSVEVGVCFEYGWSLLAQICHSKTRVISLLCGIKISAVCSFFSSQSTRRLWLTYAWMDRQNYDCQDRASIAASCGKQKSINSAFTNLGTRGPRDKLDDTTLTTYRTRRSQTLHRCGLLLQWSHVACSVCLFLWVFLLICLSVLCVGHANVHYKKRLNWSRWHVGPTRVGPKNCVLDGVENPHGNGQFCRVVRPIKKHLRESLLQCLQQKGSFSRR